MMRMWLLLMMMMDDALTSRITASTASRIVASASASASPVLAARQTSGEDTSQPQRAAGLRCGADDDQLAPPKSLRRSAAKVETGRCCRALSGTVLFGSVNAKVVVFATTAATTHAKRTITARIECMPARKA